MLIKNAKTVLSNSVLERDILIKNGKIADIAPVLEVEGEEVYDASGLTLLPGFIESHAHGAVGFLCSNEGSDLQAILDFEASEGVTTWALTHHTMAVDEFEARLPEALELIANRKTGAKIGGIHAEGPFINVSKKGAMNEKRIAAPSVEIFDRMYDACNGQMKIMTIAPEMDGAIDVIKRAVSKGVQVSAGHTDATYDQMMRAIDAGVTRMTHTFNACRVFSHREPGVLGAALTDKRVTCEVICDFGHLHPAAVNLLYQIKGSSNFCAISDSEFAAGLKEEGKIVLDGVARYIDHKAGVCRLEDGTICGSASSLYRGFKNLVSLGIPLWEVSEMCSANPAKALGIYNETGSISIGKAADIVIVDENLEIKKVLVDGRAVK